MINVSLPEHDSLSPRISIFGVGGAGGNGVNNMVRSNLEGVEFVVANTDSQSLANSLAARRIQLGVNLTKGLGAGARPDVGRAAAEEQIDDIIEALRGANMVFVAAGMGGGTGTGAAPVIARAARELGILTVGVVTKPFHFEGAHRMRLAEAGINELQQYVDTLIIIPNQNLFRLANEKTTFADAFKMADDVLHSGVRGVTDLMVMPGLINLDFADIRSVMSEMGKAMMGTGEASGANRAIDAAEAAIRNPLLDDVSMKGAKGVLINITGGYDMTLFEVDAAANRIREEVDPDANIIFGSTFSPEMDGTMRVSVVATGIESVAQQMPSKATTVMQGRGGNISQMPYSAAMQRSPQSFGNTTPAQQPQQPQQAYAPPATPHNPYMPHTPQQPQASNTPADDVARDIPLPSDVIPNIAQAHAPEMPAQAPQQTSLAGTHIPQAQVTGDAFIAPQPLQTQPQAAVHNPFIQNDVTPQYGQPQTGNFEDRAKRSPSLFERVTGIGFGKGQPQQPQQQQPAQYGQPYQQQLSVTTPTAQQKPPTAADEDLEIPAFLRRQSN
ncbi:MAG: cell division protein FtsZ [Bdellovibrionales bacterium]